MIMNKIFMLVFFLVLFPSQLFAQSNGDTQPTQASQPTQSEKVTLLKKQIKGISRDTVIRIKLITGKTLEGPCYNCDTVLSPEQVVVSRSLNTDFNIAVNYADIKEIKTGPSFNSQFKQGANIAGLFAILIVSLPYTLSTGEVIPYLQQ